MILQEARKILFEGVQMILQKVENPYQEDILKAITHKTV
jgi:hypothetical protein